MSTAADEAVSLQAALALLEQGELTVRGLLPGSSNYTFLAEVHTATLQAMVIYKPRQGEAPLWDFPRGTLYQRERAAYVLSSALGWAIVPPTVLRHGPHGQGAVQLFVDADFSRHYFKLREDETLLPALRCIAVFDLLVNNADRKAGHTLSDNAGRIWAIDHGVCFHVEDKLRTVIWDFAGEPLPAALLADLAALRPQLDPSAPLAAELLALLSSAELRALATRTDCLLDTQRFPHPDPERRCFPWPLI